MADVQISVGTEHSKISDSSISVGDVTGRDHAGRDYNVSMQARQSEEIEKLRQRIHELEQFVFGDRKLGLMGIQQQLQGGRFWILFNVVLAIALVAYELFRIAAAQ